MATEKERDGIRMRDAQDAANETLDRFWEHLSNVSSKKQRKELLAAAISVLAEELLSESV